MVRYSKLTTKQSVCYAYAFKNSPYLTIYPYAYCVELNIQKYRVTRKLIFWVCTEYSWEGNSRQLTKSDKWRNTVRIYMFLCQTVIKETKELRGIIQDLLRLSKLYSRQVAAISLSLVDRKLRWKILLQGIGLKVETDW